MVIDDRLEKHPTRMDRWHQIGRVANNLLDLKIGVDKRSST